MKTVTISESDIGVSYEACGPWRCYSLDATGSSLDELLESATILEIDQDGGELNTYGFHDAGNVVQEAVETLCRSRLSGPTLMSEQANARLIAAAPKLLDKLKSFKVLADERIPESQEELQLYLDTVALIERVEGNDNE